MRGRKPDPNSKRQRMLREREQRRVARQVEPASVKERDFEFLQTVATLNGGSDVPATLSEIADSYKVTKQSVHAWVNRLRERGWLEKNVGRERKLVGVRLTHNGKLLLEIGLGAELKE